MFRYDIPCTFTVVVKVNGLILRIQITSLQGICACCNQSYTSQVQGRQKNGLVSGRLVKLKYQIRNRNLDFNPKFSSYFRMLFHPKNLKSENNTPWFNILLQTQSIVSSAVFRVLGIYNFEATTIFFLVFFSTYESKAQHVENKLF